MPNLDMPHFICKEDPVSLEYRAFLYSYNGCIFSTTLIGFLWREDESVSIIIIKDVT